MTADTVTVIFSDAAGAEWCDLVVDIHTVTTSQIDDLATAAALTAVDDYVDSEVAAIKTKTDFLPSATAGATGGVSIVGSEMTLTSGERTTLAASVWNALTSGLTTVGSIGKLLVDRLATAIGTQVWVDAASRTLTSTAASTVSAVSGSTLTFTQYADYAATLTGLTIPSTWSKIYLTVKADEADADTAALIKIQKSVATTGDGLSYIEGAAYATAAHGSLTIDQSAGTIAIAITADAAEGLAKRQDASYDVKCITSGGAVSILTSGVAAIVSTETRSIT